ncbi:MAG: DUF2520 domain-containing protein [Deltaproteobacteria bacterium]|nr:DUF2520 domain-containing protein [Deltaproteobacteria bacterium]
MKVVLIGRGRVGSGLARELRRAGVPARNIRGSGSRPLSVGTADVVIVAVPDGAIGNVARRLAPRLRPDSVVLHCAGALGPGVLGPCAAAGAATGAMHPLVSFPAAGAVPSITGATFVIDGDPAAVRAACTITEAIGAWPLVAPLHGARYHAAAALVANGSAALAAVAVGLLERVGIEPRAAVRAVGALLRSVGDNVETVGVPGALTGPVARGDAATVLRHRKALADTPGGDAGALAAYDATAPMIVAVARAAGLSSRRAAAIRRALSKKVQG